MKSSKALSTHSKSTPALRTKKEVAVQGRESSWDSSPHFQIPVYDAELDPNCPRASVRHYNKTKKLNAIEKAKKGKGASDWIENTIKKKFEDIPIREAPTLREKAMSAAVREESMTEVEILQKIIVRENLLLELGKLLEYQVDLDSIMGEAVEIVKAIRFQTLEIIEDIYAWKKDFKAPRQFYFRGENYLLKMMKDTSFLDEYDDLGEYFGFYFGGNPLFYSGVPTDENGRSLTGTFSDKEIDGIPERRLHAAENIILKEEEQYGRHAANKSARGGDGKTPGTEGGQGGGGLDAEGSLLRSTVLAQEGSQYHLLHVGERNMAGDSMLDVGNAPNSAKEGSVTKRTSSGGAGYGARENSFGSGRIRPERKGTKRRNEDGSLKTVKVPSELKIKKGRVETLRNEVEEIKAMHAHVEDQTTAVIYDYNEASAKLGNLERKHREAVVLDKTALAQHLAVEISIAEVDVQEKTKQVKDLQRQKYFLDQEISRRKGLIKVMQSEIDASQKQSKIQNKLMKRARKEGLMTALLSTKTEVSKMEEQKKKKEKNSDEISMTSSYIVPGTSSAVDTLPMEDSQDLTAADSMFADDTYRDDRGAVEGIGERTFSPDTSQHSVFGFEESVDSVDPFDDEGTLRQQSSVYASSVQEPAGPVVGAERIVDDIHVLSSACANSVISNSLEMMWFVMVAAEDIRPRKIAIRGYVRQVLEAGRQSIEHTLETACEVTNNVLKSSYEGAVQKRVDNDVARARHNVAGSCMGHTVNAAISIVVSNKMKEEDRMVQVKKSLAKELAADFTMQTTTKAVDGHAIKVFVSKRLALDTADKTVSSAVNSVLSGIGPRMITEEAFRDLCEDMVIGPIGASLYTVDSKVMKVQRALAVARDRQKEGTVVGAIPVGAGFALAKARKSSQDKGELEIYNIDTKESVMHTFPSSSEKFKSVGEAIVEAAENVGDMNRVVYGKKLGTVQRVGMIINGKSYLVRTIRTEDGVVLEALNIMTSKIVSVRLTEEQEKSLEDTRNPNEQTRKILAECDDMQEKIPDPIVVSSSTELSRAGIIVHGSLYLVRTVKTSDGIALKTINISNSEESSVRLTTGQQKELEDAQYDAQITRKILSTDDKGKHE